MSRAHTITSVYSGGGEAPIGGSVERTGGTESGYNEDCPTGTTTFDHNLANDTGELTTCLSYALLATGGDVTVRIMGSPGTGFTIGLNDGEAVINSAGILPQDSESSNEYELTVLNANTATVNVEARFLWE